MHIGWEGKRKQSILAITELQWLHTKRNGPGRESHGFYVINGPEGFSENAQFVRVSRVPGRGQFDYASDASQHMKP